MEKLEIEMKLMDSVKYFKKKLEIGMSSTMLLSASNTN